MIAVPEKDPRPSPIAIVGIGLRLPGNVYDADSYWDLLVRARDARSPIPSDRFNIDGFHKERGGNGSLSMRHGYFLSEPVDRFDAAFFSMSAAEVARVDPQQRLLLEVMHEALENAGEVDYRGSDIAVYAGSFGQDWLAMQNKDPADGNVYGITGADDFVLANRVSYEFDLRGPSMTVKAGCSSSLIALHLACEALQRGDCSGALVGASNLLLSPEYFLALENLGALSGSGSSKSFDAGADGYARADAVNAVFVKRLDDALRDGNPIRAVVRSTAVNADGKTVGLTNPSCDAQASLIKRAYEKAGIQNPGETPVVECHGTGTATGDPLEVAAVVQVFGDQETFIGSVKPNIGHGEGAAGLSSLIKSILALERAVIPPNIKFHTPNPKIPFQERKLIVPVKPTPWPKDRQRRISVDSFGLGGANAHVILEAGPFASSSNGIHVNGDKPCPQRLLAFSAHSETSLTKMLSNYQTFVDNESFRPTDLAYTLGARRQHQKVRSFCVTDGTSFQPVPAVKTTEAKGLLYIFTGQGAQWPGMGRELIRDFPSFKQDIQQMDRWLSQALHAPSWRIEDVLSNSDDIHSAEYAQPLCTAIQIGLVNLLRSWDIHPAGVVGHSSGEISAAYAAGALSMRDAILVAFYRGVASGLQRRPGAMAAVGLGRSEVVDLLTLGTTIACENSRSSITISGDYDAVEATLERVRNQYPDALARKLRVDRAYHSEHMKSVGLPYETLISSISTPPTSLSIPFFSSVTGTPTYDAALLGPSYWRANMESPVLFLSAIESALASTDFSMALELGPHSALSGPFRQIAKEVSASIQYTSALSRGVDGTTSLLSAAGVLYTHGIVPDFAAMNPGGVTMANLPPYAWTHETGYWNESRISREYRGRRYPDHELLGVRTVGGNDLEPSWRKVLNLKEVGWLMDHVVADDVVFPAAGYVGMVGEAVRQVTETEKGFTVRGMSIGSAMLLQNGKGVEIVTRLQPSQSSGWYEFMIASFDGNKWTRHCSGEVCAGNSSTSFIGGEKKGMEGTRAVATGRWYQAAKKAGLEYGPAFQGLDGIAYNVTRGCVSAAVRAVDEPGYALHPTALDQFLQCCILGSVQGHLRLMNKLVLPVHIGEMYISHSTSESVRCEAYTKPTSADTLSAHGHFTTPDSSLIVQASNIQFRILDNHTEATALNELRQLQWRPDIDLLPPSTLIHQTTDLSACLELVEKLNILCVLQTTRKLASLSSPHHHFQRFQAWNEAYITSIQRTGSPVVRNTSSLFDLSPSECQSLIETLTAETLTTPAHPIALAVTRVHENAEAIFTGTAEPLAILLKDNLLMEIYNFFNMLDHSRFFQLLGHSNKNLRIIEIGAGTGGFTSTIVPALKEEGRGCLFSTYTYTDISSGFFKAAKERFGEYAGVEYEVLDISVDPGSQGLEVGSYDLVVAANVLHATPDLLQTMKNCRSLLRPGGRLFMLELACEAKWVNYIMGTLPGWWLGEADNRPDEPYLSAEKWDPILTQAGFDSVTSVMDQAPPFQLDNIIIARAAEDTPPASKQLGLLVADPNIETEPVKNLKAHFQLSGYEVSLCSLWDLPSSPVDIVSLLDIENPQSFFESLCEEDFRGLIRFITHAHGTGSKVLWLTGPAQMGVANPYFGMVLGFARTLRLELGGSFATVELDTHSKVEPWSSVVNVFEKMLTGHGNLDSEYAVVDGSVHVPRFLTRKMDDLLAATTESVCRRLHLGKPGLLSSLKWVGESRDVPLKEAEVEVEVRASSVHSQDVLLALGAVHSNRGLGLECAGVISCVSDAVVDGFAVGDRVLCWSPGSLATHVRVDKQWCVKIPDSLAFDEAVTLPTAYATMIRGLLEIGGLEAGDTVLVHSAAEAMGIAAIQIAQMKGAEVFATVAADEERSFLITEHGLQDSHIFSSQDSSFVAEVMHSTKSRGVDIVVNSLSGELLHESWKCVAEGGNMIDLSGRDASSNGKLDMAHFDGNRSFHGLDLPALLAQKPSLAHRLLQTVMQLYTTNHIKPITPITPFSPSDIKLAFHALQSNPPIGSICITFPEELSQQPQPQTTPGEPFTDTIHFRPDRSYVLIGGLGGLGRSAAIWLAERGAGNIIFMARSASPNAESESLARELNALDCEVQFITGSVTDRTMVEFLVSNAARPIAGVLHLALVLKDEPLLEMSFDAWKGATEAKVQGTWNLHHALANQPLDFFVLLSSIYGVQGNPKQANYAAAGTFLDSFVQFRQRQGLPASVIDLGVMEDIGFVSQHPAILENLRRAGAQLIREEDFLGSLHLAIRVSGSKPLESREGGYSNPAQFVVGLGQHPPDARGLGLKSDATAQTNGDQITETAKDDGDVLQKFMEKAVKDPDSLADEMAVAQFLAAQVAECLKTLLIFSDNSDLNLSLGLEELGVDSLIAIELQSWWIQSFASHVTILELTKSASIVELGKLARTRILEGLGGQNGNGHLE